LINDNFQAVNERITAACEDSQRARASVALLAVSKTKPLELIRAAYALGQRDFGENYLQDALPKIVGLPEASWHFIGHIQSNKTRDIATHFDFVHGVASEKIATRLNAARPDHKPPLGVFLQINLVDETAKSGVAPEQAASLAAHVMGCEQLSLIGLMGIPPAAFSLSERGQFFDQLKTLQLDLKKALPTGVLSELSMGMSEDLEVAIASGATWVRVGSALFGRRIPKEKL
jgi:pyridoxal phosphate enzyme (YggS family)